MHSGGLSAPLMPKTTNFPPFPGFSHCHPSPLHARLTSMGMKISALCVLSTDSVSKVVDILIKIGHSIGCIKSYRFFRSFLKKRAPLLSKDKELSKPYGFQDMTRASARANCAALLISKAPFLCLRRSPLEIFLIQVTHYLSHRID